MPKGRSVRPAGIPAVLFAFILELLTGAQGFSQVTATPMVIGWAELASEDPGTGYSNAAVLVPRQLLSSLSFVKVRYLSQETTDLMFRKVKENKLETVRNSVSKARAVRDLKALSIQDPARRAAELLSADASIATAEAALILALEKSADDAAQNLKTASAETGKPTPTSLVLWAEHANGTLLPVVGEPAAVCAEKKLDLLVYGSIKPRGSFLAVELVLYDAVLGREIWRSTEYAFADGLEDVVSSFERPSAEAIMGRSYARVEFSVDPPVANLYLDGVVHTSAEILYFEPGSHEAQARAQGFEIADSVFLVEPGHDSVVPLILVEKPSVGLTLSSEPPGATVHIDGTQAGLVPLDVPGAAYPRVARLSLPGYEDVQLVLRPQSLDEQLLIPLAVSDGLSFDDRFDDRKGAFYQSLGWFIASLPLTVLSGGLLQTYNQTGEELNSVTPTQKTLDSWQVGFNISNASFWAGAALSAGLMANAIVRLVLYIGSAR